jgi:hypothetical protein
MGDELNLMLILDRDMRKKFARLAPYLGAMDLKKPWTVSKNLSIPGPILSTINSWRFDRKAA